MIGYPYGQPPHQMLYDRFGNPLGQCRLIPIRFGRRVRPMVPRVRLRFNFGEPEFGELPPAAPPQMLYDGLGNPLGLFPAIAAIAAKVLPLAVKALPLVAKALPAISKALPIMSAFPVRAPGAPGGAPIPAAPPPPTLHSPMVQMVEPGPPAFAPQSCPPPTMEQCRTLYPVPPPPPPAPRRRRPRMVRARVRTT